MSQIDKIIYIPLLFWFIILFIFLYFVILSLFTLIIIVTTKTRVLYLRALYNFSKYMLRSTEYLIKEYESFIKINNMFKPYKLILKEKK
jgi:hypothetical protein